MTDKTWTPTNGMRIAEPLVEQIVDSAPATGSSITPLLGWRMVEVIAAEIDRALAGMPTAAHAGNGHATQHMGTGASASELMAQTASPPIPYTIERQSHLDPREAFAVGAPAPKRRGPKPKGGKRRGRPSKAEIAAREAAAASE